MTETNRSTPSRLHPSPRGPSEPSSRTLDVPLTTRRTSPRPEPAGSAQRNPGGREQLERVRGLHDTLAGSKGADVDYFRGLDEVAAIQKLALAEEAIYTTEVLTGAEREAFIAVRVDGKSRAAVGRELVPPVTGQRVGQIVAQALIKVQAYVSEREQTMTSAKPRRKTTKRSG